MPLTFTNFKRHVPRRGGRRSGDVDITFDNSYPTGGEPVSAADLGLKTLRRLDVGNLPGFMTRWDKATGKILVYESGTADGPLTELNDTSALLNGMVAHCVYEGS